ncbi:hypothetical protein P170DRAFT_177262 [Aspergillus steynii IBT 23096]|uniref:Uncharacterized protein n=1 Tax=Aspergillus steynii IBT 23096 TaxID=1392250 RepID=A0A2I2G8H7_9EURO|nr:uncharacterized protein P170DRAFT_177262 [Aspergillus steynii IBT 23096]PLB49189.1 hypothetical protein P170DRAFT_177262 [Aspergillus steynii IBT 23096]
MSSPSDDERHYTTIDPSRLSSDHLSPHTAVVHPETASMVAEEDPAQRDPTRPFISLKSKPHRGRFDLDDSWTWEIGSAVLSVVGIALLIGFLISIHGKPYANWQYTASPNTIIAIIAAITKAALLSAVSACLGQLKWRLYERSSSAPLEYLQTIDEASRGSWGALKVLSRVASGSKLGFLTFSGASLTFLALAVDPFAQQILSFPSRQVQALNETALIQSARNYTAGYLTADYKRISNLQTRAINSALSLPDTGLQAQCTMEKCSYPRFVSLGICSKCEDVTEQTTQDCVGTVLPTANLPVIDMNCTYTAPYEYSVTLSLDDMATGTVFDGETFKKLAVNFWTTYSRTPPPSADLEKERYKIFDIETPIVSFIATTQYASIPYTSQNTTAWPPKPSFTECVMYWCEKEYAPSNFSATSDPTPVSRAQKLQIIIQDEDYIWAKNTYKFVPPPDLIPLSNKSSTYHISQPLSMDLVSELGNLFNGSDATYHILVANNLTDVVKSLSTSLTDAIRSADVSSRISGKAFRTETYINVRWPWIILPLFVVLASTILLLATTVSTRNTVLWKNSLLPLLRSYLDVKPEDNSIALRSVDGVARGEY